VMTEIKKIMVAVDFSEYSITAVNYAILLARKFDACLLLVNVFDQKEMNALKKISKEHQNFDGESYIQDIIDKRKIDFQKMIQNIGMNESKIETNIRKGVIHKELLDEIDEKKPDLLIMGTKGNSELMDTDVGSCTKRMCRRCPIPLLILRNH